MFSMSLRYRRYVVARFLGPVALCFVSPLAAELESAREFMIATDHTSPEQIGPTLHHHHHEGEERLELELSLGADSRYVSEGRDNLDGEGGVAWANLVGHVHAVGGSIFGEVLGMQAVDANYQEINLGLGYEREFGAFTMVAAVSYLWFPQEKGDDDDIEFVLGGEWACDSGLGVAAEAVWSTEAEGWFGEVQLYYEAQICDRFTLKPSVILGLNQGYVSDEHDGVNHLAFQLEGAVALTEHLEASIHATYSEPLDERPGESLRDLFWLGGAVSYSF